MGMSHGYQRGPQRRAWNAKAANAVTKKPVSKHRSLSTPPLLGGCAAHHCQGPVIQGQLPQENTWHASGCCSVTLVSAAAGSPRIPYPAHPSFRIPPSLPPSWVSQSPLINYYFNAVLSEWRTDAHRWPTHRGEAKPKAETQELCEQGKERKISPRASGTVD